MKFVILLFAFIVVCHAAPAPEPAPAPKPAPAPAPAPKPGFLVPASPAVITSPVISYSHYIRSPLYPAYQPYIYNLGYASSYPYTTHQQIIPIHYI